jgi:transcription elongation factor GreA
MADLSLSDAANLFLESVKGSSRQAAMAELNRFQRWYGGDKSVTVMRGHDVATYGESMGPATPETMKRAEQIRAFLVFLNKEGVLDQNLSSHLRLKKGARSAGATSHASQPVAVELTAEGIAALETELASLMEQRLAVREDIRKAMLDKDFRENSPLDAAKDRQGHIEARIREIESMLKRAVVADSAAQTGKVRVGSSVTVRDVDRGRTMQYSIVGPTEANAAAGKISSVSPVGKALLDCVPGDEVEVSVPAGAMKLVIEAVEG